MSSNFDRRFPPFLIGEHDRITIGGKAFRLIYLTASSAVLRPASDEGLAETFAFDHLIVVLWIDEAHDLLDARSPREVEDMLSMLKSLMQGDEAVIVVLSGTERLGKVVRLDPQTSRRFAKLRPRDLAIGPDTADVEDLVRLYCREADMRFSPKDNLASRLIHASRGRFGRIVETTIDAIQRALHDGDSTLNVEHFATAWGVQEGCAWSDNVFVAEDWATIQLDPDADAFEITRGKRLPQARGR